MNNLESFNGPELRQEGNRTVFTEESGIGKEGELYIPYLVEQKMGQLALDLGLFEESES